MAQASRTFRVFVSSTFHDLKEERNALQQKVFPRLRELCMQHGARFQAIDLRWGVSEQASLDQQAMNICLGEIARCQKTTPRPNFIVLLGDRYGWRPLPAEIPADEFEEIERRLADHGDRALLATWYKRDGNAVPAEYCLQARTGQFEDYDVWEGQVERPLLNVLLQATAEMTLTDEQRLKYIASATHQEIAHGALQIEDAPDHVFCFFRTIKDLPQEETAKSFLDLDEKGNPDSEARQQLRNLKAQLGQLLPGNVHEYDVEWTDTGASTDHIEQLCDDVYERLSQVILQEVGAFILEEMRPPEEINPLELEITEHRKFGVDRAKFFVGRDEILETIANYVKAGSPHPLAVWGESGSGKSALMAKAVQQAIEIHPDAEVVFRFVGATPESSDGRALLESLCRQISRRYGADESTVPPGYRDLVEEFRKWLALAGAERPLILFLDALDQLSDADHARNLAWLPAELPEHVRLVVSTLPGECHSVLEGRLPPENLFELKPLPPERGSELLDLWLDDAKRTLQPHQREEVLGKFSQEGNGLPLYLRLAFDEARRWKSYTDPEETTLGPDVPGVIRDLFARLSAEGNHGEMLVSRSLGYLGAAKNGLTEDELLDVLSRDVELYAWFLESLYHTPPDLLRCVHEHLESTPSSRPPEERDKPVGEKAAEEWLEDLRGNRAKLTEFLSTVLTTPNGLRLPVVLWSRLYFDLEAYLTQRSGDGTALLAFYHRQLGEVTGEEYLSGRDKPKRHQTLVKYFEVQPLYVERDDQQTPNLRKLSELPYQQAFGEMWDELEITLCALQFVEAKCLAGMLFDLLGDCDRAMGLQSLPAVVQMRKALVLSLSSLSARPEFAAQSLYNRLVWFDTLEARLRSSLEEARSHLDRRGFWISAEAPLPGSQTAATLSIPFGIESGIQSLSPDKKAIAVASLHGNVEIRELAYGKLLYSRHLDVSRIVAVALREDSRSLAYMDAEGVIHSEQAGASFAGRSGERFFVCDPTCGVLAVRSDHALVAWHPEKDESVVLATSLPAPLVALRVSPESRKVLYVAGFKHQTIGVARRTDGAWATKALPYEGPPVVDADLDCEGKHALVASRDRRLCVLDTESHKLSAQVFYEAREDVIVRGTPEKCAFGLGDSLGWAFFATRGGHTACWNWSQDILERLEDWRPLSEPANLIHYAVLPSSGHLFLSTEKLGKTMTRQSLHQPLARHSAPVSGCLITASRKVVSASELDHSVRWYSAEGLRPLGQQAHDGPTAIARRGDTDDVIVGTHQGSVWNQPPTAEVGPKDVFGAFAEPVVSLFSAGSGTVFAASRSGKVLRLRLDADKVDVVRHSGGFQTQKKILPAGDRGLFWSVARDGRGYTVVSLVQGMEEEEVALRLRGTLQDVAVARDGATICTTGESVQILHRSAGAWVTMYRRDTPADYVAFLCGDELIAVVLREEPWLEVWSLAEGLTTLAAVDLPGSVSCLSTMEDWIVAGFLSGELMVVRLRRGLLQMGN